MGETILSGVTCEARWPLNWQAVSELAPAAIARDMQINAALLQALAMLEASHTASEENTQQPWARLEAKVDLALALLGKLLQAYAQVPDPVPVTLAANGIEWLSAHDPGTAQGILVSLWLSPSLPQPIVLPARIANVGKEGLHWRIHAEFQHISVETREWLERTVFRYHRRAIQAKH